MKIRKELILVMVFLGWGCLFSGCRSDPASVDLNKSLPSGSNTRSGEANIVRPPRYVYGVRISIWTLRAPVGQFSKNEEIWSYLDEEQTALKSRVLGLNGFRVGVGKKESLENVKRILKGMVARKFAESTLQTFNETPGTIVLERNTPAQTIFLYSEDQTLTGQDYPPGDNLIRISAVTDPDNRNISLLTITPEIQSTKTQLQIVHEYGTTRIQEKPILFPLRDMRFQLKMTDGEFIVIGPGVESARPTSPGHYFLTGTENNIEYEQILVLHPQVVRLELEN